MSADIQAVSVWVRARTRTRAGAAHSVRSACVDLVPAVRAMCVWAVVICSVWGRTTQGQRGTFNLLSFVD